MFFFLENKLVFKLFALFASRLVHRIQESLQILQNFYLEGMSIEDLRVYESEMQEETNRIVGVGEEVKSTSSSPSTPTNTPTTKTPPASLTFNTDAL